jgi:hypothetical protein
MGYIGTVPEVPSFGQTMGRALGQGLSQGISKGTDFVQKLAAKKAERQSFLDSFGGKFGGEDFWKNLDPAQKAMISQEYPDVSKMFQQDETNKIKAKNTELDIEKKQTDIQEHGEERESTIAMGNDLKNLIPYSSGNKFAEFTTTWGGLNREAIQKREELKNKGFTFADKAYTRFNKGPMTGEKLDFIRNELALRPDLSERVNKGRWDNLMQMLSIPSDTPPEVANKKIEKLVKKQKALEFSENKKNKNSKNLGAPSEDIVDYYLDKSGNDPDEAMRMAREAGYDV